MERWAIKRSYDLGLDSALAIDSDSFEGSENPERGHESR
jgi:hypothetical protein